MAGQTSAGVSDAVERGFSSAESHLKEFLSTRSTSELAAGPGKVYVLTTGWDQVTKVECLLS